MVDVRTIILGYRRVERDPQHRCALDGFPRVGREAQKARFDSFANQLVEPWFIQRRLPAVQSLDGLPRLIETRHVAATIGQTGGSDRAKMPETSNTDLHERAPRTQGWGRRPSSTRELSPGQPRPASADSLCRITLRCSEIELTESSPVRGGRPCPR